MEIENWFVEEAKTEQILFRGTRDECHEWCEEHMKEYADRVLIVRKGKS